jgi:hypothetical protein
MVIWLDMVMAGHSSKRVDLISSQVLGRHIVLRDFFRVNFSYVWVGCIFHAADHFGLEGLAFLH